MRTGLISLGLLAATTLFAAPGNDECPVHHVKMASTALRIVYGLPSRKEFEEAEVARSKFPYGRDYVLGGCVVGSRKTVQGFVCAECVKARDAWLKKNAK